MAGEQGELSTLGNTRYYTVVTTSEDTECPAQLLSVCPHNPWSVEFPDPGDRVAHDVTNPNNGPD